MGRQEDTSSPSSKGPRSWSAEEKYRVVIEAAALPETELGEFLRTKGLHAAQLEEWRRLMKSALAPGGGKGGRPAEKSDKKRVRDLERELRRKDKALAEAAALLVLKKKLAMYLGDEDESTPTRKET
jgi:transposase-like protein